MNASRVAGSTIVVASLRASFAICSLSCLFSVLYLLLSRICLYSFASTCDGPAAPLVSCAALVIVASSIESK